MHHQNSILFNSTQQPLDRFQIIGKEILFGRVIRQLADQSNGSPFFWRVDWRLLFGGAGLAILYAALLIIAYPIYLTFGTGYAIAFSLGLFGWTIGHFLWLSS